MAATFFTLDVYGLGVSGAAVDNVRITDDWFDLKGTQTAPPPVQPALWVAFLFGLAADLCAIIIARAGSPARHVARVADALAGITAAVCGELLLAHVASNQSDNPEAGQTAVFGPMVSVLMLLLILPNTVETVAVVAELVPEGD